MNNIYPDKPVITLGLRGISGYGPGSGSDRSSSSFFAEKKYVQGVNDYCLK